MPPALSEIARLIGAELIGADRKVSGVAELENAGASDLSLCFNQRRVSELKKTTAAAVVIPLRYKRLLDEVPCAVLLVDNPRLALAKIIDFFYPAQPVSPGIQPGAQVDSLAEINSAARVDAGARIGAGVKVAAGTHIESYVVLGDGVEVGRDCRLRAHCVVLDNCILGNRVTLSSGVVIGSDGFGYVTDEDRTIPIKQVGNVIIEDDVEIGANSTVDRATLGSTRIGQGTKIDNQVQVGHNVEIGKNVIIAAQVGISGSVTIKDGAVLGGQVGIADHMVIGAGAQVGAKSGVGTHVPDGARVAGYPAVPVKQWLSNIFSRRPRKKRTMNEDRQRRDK